MSTISLFVNISLITLTTPSGKLTLRKKLLQMTPGATSFKVSRDFWDTLRTRCDGSGQANFIRECDSNRSSRRNDEQIKKHTIFINRRTINPFQKERRTRACSLYSPHTLCRQKYGFPGSNPASNEFYFKQSPDSEVRLRAATLSFHIGANWKLFARSKIERRGGRSSESRRRDHPFRILEARGERINRRPR